MSKISKEIIINNKFGLHARPAGMIAALVSKAKSDIWIIMDEKKVDASSIVDILTLACSPGTKIKLEIDNPLDRNVLEHITELVKKNFGE